jgi:putative transposase
MATTLGAALVLRDRDSIYGDVFHLRARSLAINEVQKSRLRLWQNPYVERLIGSIRRECLNDVIVLDERHLRRLLSAYLT